MSLPFVRKQDLFVHPVTNYILSLITSTATAVAATLGRLGGGAFVVTLSLPVIASGTGKAHIQTASGKRLANVSSYSLLTLQRQA